MIKGVTHVPLEKLLAVVKEMGLKPEEKKSWLKVSGPGGGRVYLPKRKRVGRVDIAGFSAPKGTSVKLGTKSFGAVEEQLDMQGPEEKVVETFRAVLKHLASIPAAKVEPKKKDNHKLEVVRGK